jgi:hypothetical protein
MTWLLYENTDSKHQKQGSNQLHQLVGFGHKYKVSLFECAPGLLSIDIACKEFIVAIEYDGPSHFLKDTNFVELAAESGATKAKRQMLRSFDQS